MLYLLFAILLVIIMTTLYLSHKKGRGMKKLLQSIGFLILLLIFTYDTRIVLFYKPLVILHIALLIMAWWHYYHFIRKDILKVLWILSPLVSLGLFVILALFFRENG